MLLIIAYTSDIDCVIIIFCNEMSLQINFCRSWLIYDIFYKKKKPKSKNHQSHRLFKTLKESCGFCWCTGKTLVLLWPLVDLFKKVRTMVIYQNWLFDFLRSVTTNPNNQLHDNRWGCVPVSNNHPTPV